MDTYTAIEEGIIPKTLGQIQVQRVLRNHGHDWQSAYAEHDFPMSLDGDNWDSRALFTWLGY